MTSSIQIVAVLGVVALVGASTIPSPARRPARRLGSWIVGFLWRLGVALLFTVTDALITFWLVAYHLATARPWLVPEDWAAFLQRANDRAHGVLAHG